MALIKKNPKLVLLLTGVGFLAGGIDSFENNLKLIAFASFIATGINFIAAFFIKKYPFIIKLFILTVNAVFAAVTAYAYDVAGKDKIQYAWLFVCLLNIVVIINNMNKYLKSEKII